MAFHFTNEGDARAAEEAFAAYVAHESWADCYAELLQSFFATELAVIPEIGPAAVSREHVHGTAATFDLAVPTDLLYASELYAWRTDRIVVFVGVAGPEAQLARIDLAEIVDVLLRKASSP